MMQLLMRSDDNDHDDDASDEPKEWSETRIIAQEFNKDAYKAILDASSDDDDDNDDDVRDRSDSNDSN